MSVLIRFVNDCLDKKEYPNKPESWHVKGMLKNKSNQEFKFDVRGMQKVEVNKYEKKGFLKTNADKMVFETEKEWVIFDYEELNNYMYNNNLKDVLFDDLLVKLEWTTIIKKND